MASRGGKQKGRTGEFKPDEPATLTLRYKPGDPDRAEFERLVAALGVSAAEVARRGIRALAGQLDRTTNEETRIAS